MSHECKTTENLSYIPTVSYPVTVGNHLSAVFDTSHNFPWVVVDVKQAFCALGFDI